MKYLGYLKKGYGKILSSIINHIEQSKLRAFTEVNKALLQAYWNIGKELNFLVIGARYLGFSFGV